MTTLAQLVQPHIDLTNQEIADLLNAATATFSDNTLWSSAGLALMFGPTAVGQIDEVLKATPGYDWVRLLLAGKGIDFSSEVTQAALESLRPVLGDQVDALKAIGIRNISPYQYAGFSGTVTVEEIAAARAELVAAAAAATIGNWCDYVRAILANNGNGKSISELKALIAEYE